ncbi:hypothetical protein [Bradyrhizobium sp. DASA03120]|uniref:hypothetical protein n=1 Tax=Bradyrhizobium sp. SMVTL-02 TaxID=3395917 RepID=UPI003F6FFF86
MQKLPALAAGFVIISSLVIQLKSELVETGALDEVVLAAKAQSYARKAGAGANVAFTAVLSIIRDGPLLT